MSTMGLNFRLQITVYFQDVFRMRYFHLLTAISGQPVQDVDNLWRLHHA